MRIAFRIDISSEIGTGHYMRMSSLAEVLSEFGHSCDFFKENNEPVDYRGYDIVIVDTYRVDDEYIAMLNSEERIVICYDDNALYNYNCDVIINANLHAHELNFKFSKKTPLMLLGGKYALLRREFRESKPIGVREKANRVFVCFGGSDTRNITPHVVKALRRMESLHLIVVLGAYTKCDYEVVALANDYVKVYKAPESIAELMKQCDMAITAAGSMVYEMAALGVPTLLITQAENQIHIADYMTRKGLMKCVGNWQDASYGHLEHEVAALIKDVDRRKKESQELVAEIDKNGTLNTAQAILELVKKRNFLGYAR